MICNQCPRKCNIDRETSKGYCESFDVFKASRAGLHYWEEPCISGDNGSGTIFFTGCNLRCVFCQNYEISQNNYGIEISDNKLKEIIADLINQGANNINLVNPTHYARRLARFFKDNPCPIPIVYNTSGYESIETLKQLEGIVDIYLPDFKYIRNEKAQKYSSAKDYPDVVKIALKEMRRQIPKDEFDENGVMKRGLIVRHLVLPSNTNSSIEILNWLDENLNGTYVSLMSQYTPYGDLQNHPELNRRVTKREYDKVVNHLNNLNIVNAFVQDLSSSSEEYIPIFDLSGLM